MLYRLASVLILAIASISAHAAGNAAQHGRFVARSIEVAGQRHDYQVFVPARLSRKAPVVLFLHGSGERGSDNQAQLDAGLGPYLRRHMDDFPAIVVFPQAAEGSEWNQDFGFVLAQLQAATREFGGDPDRTYLTGLSMGGYGSWDLALREPRRFAALVPICGGLVHPGRPSMDVAALANAPDPYAAAASRLRNVPTWIFHGARDDLVPPEFSRRMHAALQAAGARDARYTEFPDANHNSWDPAYNAPELWLWLFAQKRR